jgi:imidazolonepropionase-like amidohydrolase
LIGGQGAIMKLRPGRSASAMAFPGAPLTLKMACGENPKRVYGSRKSAPSTRMGNVAGYRDAYQKAIEYGRKLRAWQSKHVKWQEKRRAFDRAEASKRAGETGGKSKKAKKVEDPGRAPDPPPRDYGLETLLGAIEGRVLVQMHCYRADEMVRMVELGNELGFRVRSFHHAVEAYKIRDLLAQHEIGISTWSDWWGFKLEAFDAIEANLGLLSEAGVKAVLHSDDNMFVQRLNQEAAKAMYAARASGIEVSEATALSWITTNPAWVLGIEDRVGSLEPGKMADVVVWSGSPFSVYTLVDQVYVDGSLAFDRAHGPRGRMSDFELGIEPEVR